MTLRTVIALAAAATVCAFGALVLGEYAFDGFTAIVGGLVSGLVVSEVVLEIGRSRHAVVGIVTGLMVAASLGWAAWLSSGEGARVAPALALVSMVTGGLTAAARIIGWWTDPFGSSSQAG